MTFAGGRSADRSRPQLPVVGTTLTSAGDKDVFVASVQP